MKPPDKRRVLASASTLLAMPFLFVCSGRHMCMGGHMAHGPYQWYDLANDLGWLTFFVIALVLAARSNIQYRKTFIVMTVIALAFRILGDEILTLFLAVALIVASIQGLIGKGAFGVRRQNIE